MKRFSWLLIFLSCGFLPVFSQPCTNCSSEEDYQIFLQKSLSGIQYTDQVQGYSGSQYLGEWRPGEVILENGDVVRNLILRYNRFSDELLWLRESDYRRGILPKSRVSGFHLSADATHESATFIRKKISLPWLGTFDAYVEVLTQGEVSIYAYRNIIKDPREFKLNDNTRYMISIDGQDHVFTWLRRRILLMLPGIQKDEMKKILRKYGIILRDNEEGLVRAIEEYNLLVY